MKKKNQIIELYFKSEVPHYCTFNLEGEFILYGEPKFSNCNKIIWIYSTQTKSNKWNCKRIYEIPEYIELLYEMPKKIELISITKYNKVYLSSNDNIYEWDILTEKSVRIFCNNKNKVIKCSK
jgi:hypothetical protein